MFKVEEFNGLLIFYYGIIYGFSRDCVYRYILVIVVIVGEDYNIFNMLFLCINIIYMGIYFIIGINFDFWVFEINLKLKNWNLILYK